MTRVGSLFTGYGGLDLAVGGDLAWYSEIEPAACQVLEHHFPGVPNLGDITKIDWTQVEPVDVITGGYPCQPFSHAGKREGDKDDRHLWPYVREAIRTIRPDYAILENVRGHLSLGFTEVLGEIASIGYDAEWGTFRASEIGAPHRRERLFILAYPDSQGIQGHEDSGSETPSTRQGHFEQGVSTLVADTDGDGYGIELHAPGMGSVEGETASEAQQRERTREVIDTGSVDDATDADNGHGQAIGEVQGLRRGHASRPDMRGLSEMDWGKYDPAIRRWEAVLERPAPDPTVVDEKTSKLRLNPVFVEWMMGLPTGWVTGHGLSRAKELKMLGNGVCPLQARVAINGLILRSAT